MSVITLKLKTKSGQHVLKTEDKTTFKNLKTMISELTGLHADELHILVGFPPKATTCDDDSLIDVAGIKNGDVLTIEQKPEERRAKEAAEMVERDRLLAEELAAQGEATAGILMKHEVPADNSCLFTSVGYVMTGKIDLGSGAFMRQIISSSVHDDKETYNAGFLGRPNDEYCAWIMQDDTWGGGIEVSILSKFYGIEFAVVDIKSAMINRFGEDQNYGSRAFLLFDGIHYDPLYLESLNVSR